MVAYLGELVKAQKGVEAGAPHRKLQLSEFTTFYEIIIIGDIELLKQLASGIGMLYHNPEFSDYSNELASNLVILKVPAI